MKRLLLVLTFLLVSGFSFAQDYGFELFSWNTSAKDVTKTLLSSGWTCRTDDTFIYFSPENMNVYYHNKLIKVKEFFFSFDSNYNLTTQNIRTDIDFSSTTAFMALLSTLQDDKALLNNNEYENTNNINYFTYDATLSDCDAHYVIMGQEAYLMAFSYRKLDR